MIPILLSLLLQENDYAPRRDLLKDSLVEERLKVAEGLEKLNAWVLARAEYQKLLVLDPGDERAKRKLQGADALPVSQERLGVEASAKYADLMWGLARVAGPGHASLAKWCAEHELPQAATRHWRLALFYAPVHAEALKALGFVGEGPAAVDPLWKDVRWKDLAAQADPGKEATDASDLEKRWGLKSAKRISSSLEWEGIGVGQDHLKALARLGEADVAFMRKLLGDEAAAPCVKRMIHMTGQSQYLRYIDDFWDAPASVKQVLRSTGGSQNVRRKEFALFTERKGDLHHDSYVAHAVGEFVLASYLGLEDYDTSPAWLKEGIGCTCEILFRGRAESSCVAIPEGTTTGDLPWQQTASWDNNLRTLVARGSDLELGELASVTLNAMKGDQRAKSASVVSFLALRWPEGFRALLAELRKNPREVRAAFQTGLGFSVEECDEFWRRWLRATGK